MLTQQRLKELFSYDEETGLFTRIKKSGYRDNLGEVSKKLDGNGYLRVRIDGVLHNLHRLAWLYVYGEFPVGVTDHINRVKTDNRIANLRDANLFQNRWNTDIRSDNKTGFRGVSWGKRDKKFIAYSGVFGKRKHLGCFDDALSASKAVEAYRESHHKIETTMKMRGGV